MLKRPALTDSDGASAAADGSYLYYDTETGRITVVRWDYHLVDSGRAQEIVDRWTDLLTTQASDLVEPTTVTTEAEAIPQALER